MFDGLSKESSEALDQWAAISKSRSEIEEFLDWLSESGRGSVLLSASRADLLDIFYEIDPRQLEAARRELLKLAGEA